MCQLPRNSYRLALARGDFKKTKTPQQRIPQQRTPQQRIPQQRTVTMTTVQTIQWTALRLMVRRQLLVLDGASPTHTLMPTTPRQSVWAKISMLRGHSKA